MSLYEDLVKFVPWNEQEQVDQKEILRRLRTEEVYTRDNLGAHLSASAWVIDSTGSYVLMCYHNLYQSWSWLGGHSDGDHDLLHVAIKEVQEESGLKHIIPVTNDIFSVEILNVQGHEKHGIYVPSHLHLNVTYLLQADMAENLQSKPDENQDVKWFLKEECLDDVSEEWMKDRIYQKLLQKMELYI